MFYTDSFQYSVDVDSAYEDKAAIREINRLSVICPWSSDCEKKPLKLKDLKVGYFIKSDISVVLLNYLRHLEDSWFHFGGHLIIPNYATLS